MKKKSTRLSKITSSPRKQNKKTIAVGKKTAKKAVKKTTGPAITKKKDTRLKDALRELKELKAQNKLRDKKCQQMEREFHANQTKYKAIVDNSLSALLLGEPNGGILEVNQAACNMFGYTAKEFVKIKRQDFMETNPEMLKKLKERTQTKKAVGELVGIRKNGKRFPCQISSVIFTAANGEEYSSTTIIDISEKKKQEEAILEANLHMQMILDNTDESFFVVDRNLNVLTFNKTAQKKAKQLIGKEFKKGDRILDFAMTDRVKELKKMYAYILEGNTYYYKYTAYNKKKEEVVLGLNFSPIKIDDRVMAIMVNARDITTEVKQEKELLQSEERYRHLFNNNPMPMWIYDPGTLAFLEVNNAAIKHYGYSRKEFLSMTILDIRPKEEAKEFLKVIGENKKNSLFKSTGSWHHIKKGGERIQVEVTSHIIDYNGGTANLILSNDISDRVKSEKEKEFNTRNTEALINSTNDLIWSIDKERKLIIGNNSFLKFIEIHTGKKLKPGVELLKVDYFSEEDIRHWEALYSRVLSGESFSVINSLKTDNGEIWSETYFDPIMENENVLGAAMYTKNITDRKKLEDQRALYVSIVNSSEDAILSKTLDGTIISWNKGAQKLFGYTAQEAIGKNITMLIPPALMGEEAGILAELKTGKHIESLETVRMKKDGSMVNISLTVSPITDSSGVVVGASKIARDITGRKQTEEQLTALNIELKKRAEELSNSNTELEQFAYIASHDLQEPLRMVSSFLQLLQKKSEKELDETSNKYIHYAVDGAERMKGLILDLLQYSRAGTSTIIPEPIQMNELVEEVLMLYKSSDAEFDIGPLPTIQAGKIAMTQLMQNLIGNGIKYRSDRKPIVRVRAEENKTEWKFTVEDNGIGIDPKYYDKIFVVFQRLHNKDKYGGTGVGLAICKKIVERYKGKIWVESEPGTGSKFIFTISKNQAN